MVITVAVRVIALYAFVRALGALQDLAYMVVAEPNELTLSVLIGIGASFVYLLLPAAALWLWAAPIARLISNTEFTLLTDDAERIGLVLLRGGLLVSGIWVIAQVIPYSVKISTGFIIGGRGGYVVELLPEVLYVIASFIVGGGLIVWARVAKWGFSKSE